MLSNYNFNLNPYYDDFDENKNFHRILFKPGYAVQARELTQLQTQLQDQISKFGDHIFREGSVVLGGNFNFASTNYIRVSRNNDISNFDNQSFYGVKSVQATAFSSGINSITISDVSSLGIQIGSIVSGTGISSNTTITSINPSTNTVFLSTSTTASGGGTSLLSIIGAKAKVVKVVAESDEVAKVYFTYTNGLLFKRNEVVVCENTNSETIVDNENFNGTATAFSIDEGIFYIYGNFVYCNPQVIIIAEDELATCRIGLLAEEAIVTSKQNTSLLDPALGSYNYSAPGADRYSISLELLSFEYDPQNDSAEENASDNFIELSRFKEGLQVSVNKYPIYSEIENTLARRTYDESGDYTVKSFGLKVVDHIYANTDLLSLQIEPGKAYVKGYEFETISPTYIDLPKSRTTVNENEFPLYINYGQYLYVETMSGGVLDFTDNRTVSLKSNTAAVIGNCTVKYIEFDSYDSGANKNIYKLYIDNVNIFNPTNLSVSDVRVINTSTFSVNISTNSYSSIVEILGNDNSSYIVDLPKEFVANVDSTETSYETLVRVPVNASFSSNGSFTTSTLDNTGSSNQIFLGTGLLSESDMRQLYIIVVATTTNPGSIATGTVLDPDTHGLTINVIDEDTLQITTNIDVAFTATVFARVAISGAIRKTKTIQDGLITITGPSLTKANLIGTISLNKSDCFELSSITATVGSNEYDYTKSYDFNSGQTDTLYDHGSIKLKSGYPDPISDSAGVTSVTIRFKYFSHSGTSSGFFNVNSYPTYDDIPTYTTSVGQTLDLRNCFDFRPRRIDDSTGISGSLLAKPGSLLITDFDHYVGRIDKLVLTKERKFGLIQGIPSINPSVPADIPDSMGLYIINVPPYTKFKNQVTTTFIENKRYTMRDIGRIEKRVERMEFYTALSLLEKQANDESIPSDIPTIDRFKNGILVDSFAGHSVGDVSNPDYRCSIDFTNKILRPSFSSTSYNFLFKTGTNHKKSGDLITVKYITETFVNQPLASRTVNVNPYNVFKWNGFVDLDPPSDTWVDTQILPDVTVNLNGENDYYTQFVDPNDVSITSSTTSGGGTITHPIVNGTRWDDWQTVVKGIPQASTQISQSSATTTSGSIQTTTTTSTSTTTTTTSDTLARVGLDIKTGSIQTITRDLGTKIVDASIVPFIRSRIVSFSARCLKPQTQLFATFDGVDVTSYCVPAVEIVLTEKINQNAQSISLTSNTSITAAILHRRGDRIFVNESDGIFRTGNTVNWIVDGVNTGTGRIAFVARRNQLITNEFGDIAGRFLIPANQNIRFRTGERQFRLADSIDENASTAAASKYIAQGLSLSTERTLVSTRVASTSIEPVLETRDSTTVETRSSVIGTSTTSVDLSPPPPLPPAAPPVVACAHNENGGRQGTFTYTINFGANTGPCGITYDAFSSIPDRFTIIWNGREFSSGFVGGTTYNAQLRSLGFPDVSGPRTGNLIFNKTSTEPTTALLRVDAPIAGTAWKYRIVCPNVAPSPPLPIIPPSIDFTITTAATVAFTWDQARNNIGVQNSALRLFVTTTGTNAQYVRVSNLNISAIDESGNPVTGISISPTTRDFETVVSTINRRGNSNSVNIVFPRPARNRGTYRVTVSGTVTVFSDSGRTNAVLTTNAITTATVNRDDNLGMPVDPVAQTFFVDASRYPNGLFLDSIDLYFKTKSPNLPISVELRPTVNGYPSSKDIVPFSVVDLLPEDVKISNDASLTTNFKFKSPVYLPAGEHSFVVRANSTDYEMFTGVLGEFLISNPDVRITQQPAVGSMFKSQNSSTWTPVQEEDVAFRLNKCVFDTSVVAEANFDTNFTENGNIVYDVFFADGENLDFASTKIDYYYKTTSESGDTDNQFTQYQLGSNVPMVSRRILRAGRTNDLQFKVALSTVDSDISPVIDLTRLSTVLVQNIINNGGLSSANYLISNFGNGYSSNANVAISSTTGSGATATARYNSNLNRLEILSLTEGSGYTGEVFATISGGGASANAEVIVQNEVGTQGGNALARYITRKVTLAPNFESLDLKAYMLASVPSGTSIKMYYKVAPITSAFFEGEPWREMELESSGNPSETGYVDYKYKTPGDTAIPSGERFKTFSIKIVMYSSNPVRVPQVRDLRVIALDD